MNKLIPLSLASFLTSATVHAQVTLDGTLGPATALEGPDYAISAELGQLHGRNLFHSFGEFNLQFDESAIFSGPDSISNVISRVTSGNPSSIDGTIRSLIPEANVYLINPAGLMFGPDATLDVQGSFHASTADTLRFSDGGEFNARNTSQSLLTVAPISAFGFLTSSPQPLTIDGSQLSTPSDKTLSVIGGHLKIFNNALLNAASGRINLASAANQGEVTVLPQDLVLSGQASDITLQDSQVTVSGLTEDYEPTASGGGGGSIYIRGGRFLVDETNVIAETYGSANGGEINVQADELTISHGGSFSGSTLAGGQGAHLKIQVAGITKLSGQRRNGLQLPSLIQSESWDEGDGGNIDLETGSLHLQDGAYIRTNTWFLGRGGNISIRATDTLTLSGTNTLGENSHIAANTYGEEKASGGTIVLETRQLHLMEGVEITSTTEGAGQGGLIQIKATDSIILSGNSKMISSTTGEGDGGGLEMVANQLILRDGSQISGGSGGSGQGSYLNIQVSDLVMLEGVNSAGNGNRITANAQGTTAEAGDSGTVMLKAGRLHLAEGAQIGTSTFGPGQGGKLSVEVAKEATLSGQDKEGFSSGLFTSSQSTDDNPGHGGTLVLKVGDLYLTDQAEIFAETWGDGKGGHVEIDAQNLHLVSNAQITAHSRNKGDAGNIVLIIGNRLLLRDQSQIITSAESADGGNIIITAPNYAYLINSQISSCVNEEFGGGGNLTLKPNFVVLDGSQIFAKAKKGAGGNIDVTTTGIYNFTGELIGQIINASSEFGVDGEVTISTPDGNAVEGLFALPADFVDASQLIDTPCDQRVAENLSSLVLISSEGATNAVADLFASGPLLRQIDQPAADSQTGNQPNRQVALAFWTGCRARGYKPATKESHLIPEQLF